MIYNYDGYCRSDKNNVLYAYKGTFESTKSQITWQADVTLNGQHKWNVKGKFISSIEDTVRRIIEETTKEKIRALAAAIE